MQKYRASNRMSFGGFILLLVLAIISAAALGGVLFALDYYLHLYLVLIFPMFAGAIAGGLLVRGVYSAKVRSPLVAGIVGLLCGVLMFGVYHAASYYIGFRTDMRKIYVENAGREPTDEQFNKELDALLQDEVGSTGIVGYLKEVAKEGMSITSTNPGSSSTPVELQGNLVWGYWGVEILLAGLFAAFIAGRAAGEPFNEDTEEWYGPAMRFASADRKSRKDLINSLKDGNFLQAGMLLTTQDIKYPRLDVNVRRSKDGGSSQDTFVQVMYSQRRGRSNAIKSGMVSSSDFESLQRGMSQAPSITTTR
jgi:hypothetical protein